MRDTTGMENQSLKSTKKTLLQFLQNQHLRFGVFLALTIIAIWMAYSLFAIGSLAPPEKGDAYGSLNTLFSGLAFGGVILAIIMQGQELRLQREEMSLQREELERTRKEFEELTNTAELQRFEHSFFNLLNGFQSLISGLSVTYHVKEVNSSKIKTVHGENVFYSLLHDRILLDGDTAKQQTSIIYDLESVVISSDTSSIDLSDTLITSIEKLPPIHDISHYFRYLFRIIYFIDRSKAFDHKYDKYRNDLDDDEIDDLIFFDKCHYTNIVQSYLSENQLLFLYMNGLNPDFRIMKVYIERYSLLKNLTGKSATLKNYKKYYEREAFEPIRFRKISRTVSKRRLL